MFMGTLAMSPVHGVNSWLQESTSLFPTLVRDRSSLLDEIRTLEHELLVANNSAITLERMTAENQRLRSLLGIEETNTVAAGVIARPNQLPYDLLQIDKGRNDGVRIGAPVYAGAETVVGQIVQSAPTYSFVRLLTSPGVEATGFIEGANVAAVIEGYGGGVARVRVPQGIFLQEGNLVHVLGTEPGVFGRIASIENEPTQPDQYGYIVPDVSINGLHIVQVALEFPEVRPLEAITADIEALLEQQLVIEEVPVVTVSTSTATTTNITATSSDQE